MSGGELAGTLRERLTLERRAAGRDGMGGADGAWSTIGTVWAALEPRTSGPAVQGDALDMRPRWRVTLRAGSGIAVGDRLVWRARYLRVRGVTDDPALPDRTSVEAEEER